MTEEKRLEEIKPSVEAEVPADESVGDVDLSTAAEPHKMAEINEEERASVDEVRQMESVPPYVQNDDPPVEVTAVRESSRPARPLFVDNEKKYGPFSGSMWFLVVSVITFIISIIFAMAG